MKFLQPNSPEAMEICKGIAEEHRKKAGEKVHLDLEPQRRGRKAKFTPEIRRAIFEDWKDGATYPQLQKKHGGSLSTLSKIIQEESAEMNAKTKKAPATVEEPTSARENAQDEYTTLDEISKEMTVKQARAEIVNAAVRAVIDLLKVPASSAIFDYKVKDDGQCGYVPKYPTDIVDTLGIIVDICNAIKGVAE